MAKRKKLSITPEEKLLVAILGGTPGARRKKSASLPETRATDIQSGLKREIKRILQTFPREDQEVIKLRYGLGDGYTRTRKETARIFRTTDARIRKLEARAVQKLQGALHSLQREKVPGKSSNTG